MNTTPHPISPLTNSEIGSRHWYNTLLGSIQRIGEYIAEHANQPLIREYGNTLKTGADHLYENYNQITDPGKGAVEKSMLEMLELAVVVEAKKAISQRDTHVLLLKKGVDQLRRAQMDCWVQETQVIIDEIDAAIKLAESPLQ